VKAEIRQLINKHPRSWIYTVKKNKEWLAFFDTIAEKYSTSIQGAVYIFLNDYDPVCQHNNLKKFTWFSQGFSYCGTRKNCQCNSESSVNKAKQTSMEKYGTSHPMQNQQVKTKAEASTLLKHGVKYTSQIHESRVKAKQTSMEKYGTTHPMQNQQVKDRCKQSNIANHNGVISAATQEVKERTQRTMQEKYSVTNFNYAVMAKETAYILLHKSEFKKYCKGKSIPYIAQCLQVDKNTVRKYVQLYNAHSLITKSLSAIEESVKTILDQCNVRYEQANRTLIKPLELDFYLPDYSAAIEVNGLYWHSEIAGKKDKNYHFAKWKMCKEQDIDLYQYFEDEITNNIDAIKAKIQYIIHNNKCIVGARQCKLTNIEYTTEAEFLNKHHIQGSSKARNKTIGAYYNDKLVAVFSWIQRKQYLEITRFACDTNASYPGLFSKMMKHMIAELNYTGKIVSFSNNGHSNGNVYKASGFTNEAVLGPAYWYTRTYANRENRQKYMKSKIAKKFGVDTTRSTEWELMKELGYDRIWDSGKIKWVKEI